MSMRSIPLPDNGRSFAAFDARKRVRRRCFEPWHLSPVAAPRNGFKAHQERDRRAGSGRRWSDRLEAPLVLVVEPHDDTRFLYTYLFETYGYAVHAAADALSALQVASIRLPDVIVMELALPKIGGSEMLMRLRQNPSTSETPCVVVSSLLHFGEPDRAREAGAAAFLAKPVDITRLVNEVETALRATPRRRIIERQLRRTLSTLHEVAHRVKVGVRAQERVRSLIDRLQIAVLAFDEAGHYVAASPAASVLTGYSREELLHMSTDEGDVPLAVPVSAAASKPIPDPPAGTLRTRTGDEVTIQTAFASILPGLDAAAFAIADYIEREELR
jgi:two-component system cell cycle response regulator DivK